MSRGSFSAQPTFEPVLTGSARTGRLIQVCEDGASGKSPVLLVAALTANAPCQALATTRKLAPFLAERGRALYIVQWENHWTNTRNERFTPLVRDLGIHLQNDVFKDVPIHVAASGSGALVALKYLRAIEPDPAPMASLSLLAPSLRVQHRAPRTPMGNFPKNCCVVADEKCTVTPWQDTVNLARRMPVVPRFLLAQARDSYWMTDDAETLKPDRFVQYAVRMAGAWDGAWADWLQEIDLASITSECVQVNG